MSFYKQPKKLFAYSDSRMYIIIGTCIRAEYDFILIRLYIISFVLINQKFSLEETNSTNVYIPWNILSYMRWTSRTFDYNNKNSHILITTEYIWILLNTFESCYHIFGVPSKKWMIFFSVSQKFCTEYHEWLKVSINQYVGQKSV